MFCASVFLGVPCVCLPKLAIFQFSKHQSHERVLFSGIARAIIANGTCCPLASIGIPNLPLSVQSVIIVGHYLWRLVSKEGMGQLAQSGTILVSWHAASSASLSWPFFINYALFHLMKRLTVREPFSGTRSGEYDKISERQAFAVFSLLPLLH